MLPMGKALVNLNQEICVQIKLSRIMASGAQINCVIESAPISVFSQYIK